MPEKPDQLGECRRVAGAGGAHPKPKRGAHHESSR
jgi:hypothetical protein